MRRATLALLLLTAAALHIARCDEPSSDLENLASDPRIYRVDSNLSGQYELAKNETSEAEKLLHNAKIQILDENGTIHILEDFQGDNSTTDDIGPHDPVVRGKRTLGDIVFRGLADVLGYSVQRRPPQIVFPPPVAPLPVLAAAPVLPPVPPPPPPCGVRTAVLNPCGRALLPPPSPPPPPPPNRQPPCPRPRAIAILPPPPPPCSQPRGALGAPSPCALPPKLPPPPQQVAPLETIQSNFNLNFNWNRNPASPAPAAESSSTAEQLNQEELQTAQPPVRFQPAPARVPPPQPRKPRVFVDAFVVRSDGVTQKVPTIDADQFNPQQYDNADYANPQEAVDYEDEPAPRARAPPPAYDYYDGEDTQESRNTHARDPRQQKNTKIAANFGTAIDKFWEGPAEAAKKPKLKKQKAPNHYQNVHFGDRELYSEATPRAQRRGPSIPFQSLVKDSPLPNRIHVADKRKYNEAERHHYKVNDDNDYHDGEKDVEKTTSTEDPHRVLVPPVLPPTENHPNQIDTVTVRVPPIYKEKRPRKLHRADRDEEENYVQNRRNYSTDSDEDSDGENTKSFENHQRSRRNKNGQSRKLRSVEDYEAGDYDYFGHKLPVSDEELEYRQLTIAPRTMELDLARLERKDFEEDEKVADERERTDILGPNALVVESGYSNNYAKATSVQVDNPNAHKK